MIIRNAILAALGVLCALVAAPAQALQCVPYAREASGLDLRGDAWTWWGNAVGRYERGAAPKLGSVLVFKRQNRMRHGHVSVVTRVIDRRQVLVEHANWAPNRSRARGQITRNVRVMDVSMANDWSQVRVWNDGADTFGRPYPTFGFIYSPDLRRRPSRGGDRWAALAQVESAEVASARTEAREAAAALDPATVAEQVAAAPAAGVAAAPTAGAAPVIPAVERVALAAVETPVSAPVAAAETAPAGNAAVDDIEAARRAGSMSYGGMSLAQVSTARRSADN